jgi:predicted glycosyltransferase
MVYSHDAFGLGNIRRMLEICKHLLDYLPDISILLLSGSPMLQSFRLPQGLDYIKLPCINRGESGDLAAKYLSTDIEETVKLRSDLILAAARNFKPDLVLVDKKPYGIKGELTRTLNYIRNRLPQTCLVLLLRDILDTPETTIRDWQQQDYYKAVELFYDRVLVVGMPEVFDVCQEYQFPAAVAKKVRFCGYIRKELGLKSRNLVRQELGIKPQEQLVLVTPGGGEDGYRLLETYLSAIQNPKSKIQNLKSLIVCGPEMPADLREQIYQLAKDPNVQIEEFSDDLMSYIDAADAVVCMGGYNTVSEVLQLNKRAIVIPRFKPSQEQLIRSQRMADLGLLSAIHPDNLTPENLRQTLFNNLQENYDLPVIPRLDFNGLSRIAKEISDLLFNSFAFSRESRAKTQRRKEYKDNLIALNAVRS